MKKTENSDLDNIYAFMTHAYQGNWQNRWSETPYMAKANEDGKTESILAHQWGMMAWWYQLRRVSSQLDAAVNSEYLYEVIMNHDLGETHLGDISAFMQMQGKGVDKGALETEEVKKMTAYVPEKIRHDIREMFDAYERPLHEITNIEVLVAKFLDAFQGDHFAMTFGNELAQYSEPISKIVSKRFVPYTKRLMEVLEANGQKGASEEVKALAQHHILQIQAKNITLDENILT